ncbi:MAG: hypothetical protein WC004_02995 [Candidatus Absconditabacterales bacterium]
MLDTLTNFNYFLLGIVGVICIFAVAIGIDKMAKVVVGNYILGVICLAVNNVISLAINYINTMQINNPNASYSQLQTFLVTGKTGIILVFYLILLIILLTKTKIHVETSHMPLPKSGIMAVMVIMTVVSVLLTIAIAVRGIQIIDYAQVVNIAKYFLQYPLLYNLIQYIPLVLLIHGLATLYLISEFDGD